MGIHVITNTVTEFHKYEKPVPKQQLVNIMGYIYFLTEIHVRRAGARWLGPL